MGAQAAARPVYEELDGWEETTNGARSFAQLPANAVKYVKRLEELVECPVALLSTSPGPGRHHPGAGSVCGLRLRSQGRDQELPLPRYGTPIR